MRKDGHLSKPVGERGIHPKKPSSSWDENNRRQGQDLLGHPFSRKAFIPRILEITRDKQGNRDKKRLTKQPHKRKKTIPLRNLDSETQAARSDKRNRRNPKYQIPRDCTYWKTVEKPAQGNIQGVGIYLCKTKHHQRVEASCDGHIR